jgi:hypothetical protein
VTSTVTDAEVLRLRSVLDKLDESITYGQQRRANKLAGLYLALLQESSPAAAARCRQRWEHLRRFCAPPTPQLIDAMGKLGIHANAMKP